MESDKPTIAAKSSVNNFFIWELLRCCEWLDCSTESCGNVTGTKVERAQQKKPGQGRASWNRGSSVRVTVNVEAPGFQRQLGQSHGSRSLWRVRGDVGSDLGKRCCLGLEASVHGNTACINNDECVFRFCVTKKANDTGIVGV